MITRVADQCGAAFDRPGDIHRAAAREQRAAAQHAVMTSGVERWSRLAGQNGGLAKVDSGFIYAANFSWFVCVA
jgi:hypothetical protein